LICLVDEATGEQIESRPTSESGDLRVERGIAIWGSSSVVLDKGEEVSAKPIILGLVVFFQDRTGSIDSDVVETGISLIVSGIVWMAVGLMLTQIVSAVAHYIGYRTSSPGTPSDE
jgi:hypothetical protein